MIDRYIKAIERKFPVPARVADQVKNVVERYRGSYILYESRPILFAKDEQKEWVKIGVAKFTFVKKINKWKLYWMRASGNWELFEKFKSFNAALNAVEKDKWGCFWG